MYKDILEDLKLEYDRRERASESLTRKSQHLVTVSAIMATLIAGFLGALLQLEQSNMDDVLIWLWLIPGILLLAVIWSIPIILLLAAIIMACVKLNSAEDQKTIFLGTKLTDDSGTNFKIIDEWAKLKDEHYNRALINEYVQCLKHEEDAIENKSRWLVGIIGTFITSLVSFPIVVVVTLV